MMLVNTLLILCLPCLPSAQINLCGKPSTIKSHMAVSILDSDYMYGTPWFHMKLYISAWNQVVLVKTHIGINIIIYKMGEILFLYYDNFIICEVMSLFLMPLHTSGRLE